MKVQITNLQDGGFDVTIDDETHHVAFSDDIFTGVCHSEYTSRSHRYGHLKPLNIDGIWVDGVVKKSTKRLVVLIEVKKNYTKVAEAIASVAI